MQAMEIPPNGASFVKCGDGKGYVKIVLAR